MGSCSPIPMDEIKLSQGEIEDALKFLNAGPILKEMTDEGKKILKRIPTQFELLKLRIDRLIQYGL